ncbi:MAG: hypothetical protein COV52_04420 [Gammaproteobacteria bacterium CG11_big_fil_rev_8_21_14_0_20_46_22]|nr:MAG: hypothetical protein COV52_04420 [Gammaproteobacteria bacterium CG11_big_fil_rev_8_21_14_0_20_46_22]
MKAVTLSIDWMLSELILNDGYSKQQLAHCLNTTLPKINDALNQSREQLLEQSFRQQLKRLYLIRRHT